jgi:hypothetical protein
VTGDSNRSQSYIRPLNLQPQRQRCGRIERFSKWKKIFLFSNSNMGNNVPNNHKLNQMAINVQFRCKVDKMALKYQHLPFQDLLNFTKIGIFWYIDNTPSGNTVIDSIL